jgi:HSP90 family molecular chaperone
VNEVRACKRALALKPDNQPRIVLTLDHSNRNLVIHGINSLGMPLRRFKEVLAVLGETDNDSGDEIGQFGMGHLSFRALSDNILFESFSLESDEKYSYLGNGEKYERLPEPRGLTSSGTRVTVTLRGDIDIRKLEEYARSVSAYSNVDTLLTVLNEDGNVIRCWFRGAPIRALLQLFSF